MKKTSKKIAATLLTAALTSTIIMGTPFKANATSILINYSDPWNGTGTITFDVEAITPDRFIELKYGEEIVESNNYTVTEYKGGTVITLKEDYVQKQDLDGKDVTFYARFAGKKALPLMGIVLEDGQKEVTVQRENNGVIDKITLEKPLFEREDVDASKYVVTTTDDNFNIAFDEEYLNSIETAKSFGLYIRQDAEVPLKLVKGQAGDVNGSGTVELDDAQEILKTALKIKDSDGSEIKLSDINNDNEVTLEDAQLALKKALKIQ